MDPLGPADESCYVSGGVDMNGVIQMLAGQARQNMVATLDVAMPVPSLTGIICSCLLPTLVVISIKF